MDKADKIDICCWMINFLRKRVKYSKYHQQSDFVELYETWIKEFKKSLHKLIDQH